MTSDISNSPLSTPMVLTPDSTGGIPSNTSSTLDPSSSTSKNRVSLAIDVSGSNALSSTDQAAATKKARRQTAFYPNVNSSNKQQKPFSRSAAKRESVMALGSIEHLQYYFTKTGLTAKKSSLPKTHQHLVPAIGGSLAHVRNNSSLNDFLLPPTPVAPSAPPVAFPPTIKTYEVHPETLLPGVIDDLTAVSTAWNITPNSMSASTSTSSSSASASSSSLSASTTRSSGSGFLGETLQTASGGVNILTLLKLTTSTIRSVRNYLVSLPDESTGSIRAQFRSKLIASSVPPVHKRLMMSQQAKDDPLLIIRKAALEVLTVLRELEEKSRVPLSDDAYDAQSDGGGSTSGGGSTTGGGRHSRVASPSSQTSDIPPSSPSSDPNESLHVDPDTTISFSFVPVVGKGPVPVWEDDEVPFQNGDEEEAKPEPWDERLVLGSGWLYKQDMRLDELGRECEVVRSYLDVVDTVLFTGEKDGKRGWEREQERIRLRSRDAAAAALSMKNRRVSAGDAEGFTFPPPHAKAQRRVVSMGMMGMMGGLKMTDEPQDMSSLKEEDEDEDEDGIHEQEEQEDLESTPVQRRYEDEDLPPWAQEGQFMDDDLGRTHALLQAYLPPSLLPSLSPLSSPSDRLQFLSSLASGQLLCSAYNACVRKSPQPWGYINIDSVHDIIALERAASATSAALSSSPNQTGLVEAKHKTWTFRRIDNLRLWVGALKLRYQLPIVSPPSGTGSSTPAGSNTPLASPSPGVSRFNTSASTGIGTSSRIEPPIIFDAKVVAKQEEGWDGILEAALVAWTRRAVAERRGEQWHR